MSDLRNAILDARYIDMIALADFIVRDCGLPESDADGQPMPQATEVAAAVFRWAAGAEALPARGLANPLQPDGALDFTEYDENGDPIMDAEEAAQLEAERAAAVQETREPD